MGRARMHLLLLFPLFFGDASGASTTAASRDPSDAGVFIGVSRLLGAGVEVATPHWEYEYCNEPCGKPVGVVQTPWDFDIPPYRLALVAPRLGVDVVIARRFTIGIAPILWYSDIPEHPVSQGRASGHAWLFGAAPRVGALVPFGKGVVFWPRIALTATQARANEHESTRSKAYGDVWESDHVERYSLLALSLEPTLVVPITAGFAVTASIDVDVALSATRHKVFSSGDTENNDWAASSVAVSIGALYGR
jgi:hypothetical protein